jgi:hypothetical protein
MRLSTGIWFILLVYLSTFSKQALTAYAVNACLEKVHKYFNGGSH